MYINWTEILMASNLILNIDTVENLIFAMCFFVAMATFAHGLFQWEEEVNHEHNTEDAISNWFFDTEDETVHPLWFHGEESEDETMEYEPTYFFEEVGNEFLVAAGELVEYIDLLFALTEEEPVELPMVELGEQLDGPDATWETVVENVEALLWELDTIGNPDRADAFYSYGYCGS